MFVKTDVSPASKPKAGAAFFTQSYMAGNCRPSTKSMYHFLKFTLLH